MRATVTKMDLLDAMTCVDHGGGTGKRGDAAFLRFDGYSLEISTSCWRDSYKTVFSASIKASFRKSATIAVNLYSLRNAVGKIAKASGPDVSIENDEATLRLRCGSMCAVVSEDDLYYYDELPAEHPDGLAAVLSRDDLRPALDMLAALKPVEVHGCTYAQSLAVFSGMAYATDMMNIYTVGLCSNRNGFISRAAVERLRAMKSWQAVKLWMWRDGDALCGSADLDNSGVRAVMSWTTRVTGGTVACDPLESVITGGEMKALLDGLASAPCWRCDGSALRQALRECEAFCRRGQAVLFIPCEEGARLVRYDVPDKTTADVKDAVNSADACATVCKAVWPFPSRIALPRKSLAKIVGKSDEVIMRIKDGIAAIGVTGDPVSRVIAEAICPFEDRTDIF